MISISTVFCIQSLQHSLYSTSLLWLQALSVCRNKISLPLLLHQLLVFIALYSLQLINTMLGYTCQQLIFFQNLPLRECMDTLVKQLHLPPHHHHQKAFCQFLSCFFFFLYRGSQRTMIETTTFIFTHRTCFHCLNSYHSRV